MATDYSGLGESDYKRLEQLGSRIYGPQGRPITQRLAPSIICRAEAELFGISTPRFARRVYLGSDAFLNFRRIDELKIAVDGEGWFTFQGDRPFSDRMCEFRVVRDDGAAPSSVMKGGATRADCFFGIPNQGELRGYRYLSADLAWAYGESDPSRGVPFVKHIRLGGGMCAQACCYMATALCEFDARAVHGLGEITSLMIDDDAPRLRVGGKTINEMQHYLRTAAGLDAAVQELQLEKSHDLQSIRVSMLRVGLRAYLRAGYPVIMLVQQGIRKIWEKNRLTIPEALPDQFRHAVLLGGWNPHRTDMFIVHDPATEPFLEASIEDLVEAGAGAESTAPNSVSFIVVGAERTRKSLFPQKGEGTIGDLHELLLRFQLDQRSAAFQGELYPIDRPALAAPNAQAGSTSKWRKALAARMDAASASWVYVTRGADKGRATIDRWNANPRRVGRWQETGALLLPKDTEEQAVHETLEESCGGYRGAFRTTPARPKRAANYATPLGGKKKVDVSTITSFQIAEESVGTEALNQKLWEAGSTRLDYYCFMNADIEEISQRLIKGGFFGFKRCKTAVDFMSENFDNDVVLSKTADFIRSRSKPQSLAGLASFVPECSALLGTPAQQRAQRALAFLYCLALRLRNHATFVVEVVGGSVVQGIFRAKNTNGDLSGRFEQPGNPEEYFARRVRMSEAQRNLLHSMGAALRLVQKRVRLDEKVVFGIELEPGPLYVVNDKRALESISEYLTDMKPELSRHIGFNLDISHWIQAGVDVEAFERALVRKTERSSWDRIVDRIVHAHISGHHPKAHFGDTWLKPDHALHRKWVSLLPVIADSASHRGDRLPPFSGVVAIEFEACREPSKLVETVRLVRKWLDGDTASGDLGTHRGTGLAVGR